MSCIDSTSWNSTRKAASVIDYQSTVNPVLSSHSKEGLFSRLVMLNAGRKYCRMNQSKQNGKNGDFLSAVNILQLIIGFISFSIFVFVLLQYTVK